MPIINLKERKEYQTKYHREIWYPKNKIRRIELVKKNKKRILKKIQEYKTSIGCIDCGYNIHPEVLDFDHKETKSFSISSAQNKGYSWDKIMNEIKKCDVVCSNCHRLRTLKRRQVLC